MPPKASPRTATTPTPRQPNSPRSPASPPAAKDATTKPAAKASSARRPSSPASSRRAKSTASAAPGTTEKKAPPPPNIPKRRLSFGAGADDEVVLPAAPLFEDSSASPARTANNDPAAADAASRQSQPHDAEGQSPSAAAADNDEPSSPTVGSKAHKGKSIVRLYGEIAEASRDPPALFNLGWMYLHGVGGVSQNEAKAYAYLFHCVEACNGRGRSPAKQKQQKKAAENNDDGGAAADEEEAAAQKTKKSYDRYKAMAEYHMGLIQTSMNYAAEPPLVEASPSRKRKGASPKKASPRQTPAKSPKSTTKKASQKKDDKYGGVEFGVKSLQDAAASGSALAAFKLGHYFAPVPSEELAKAQEARIKAAEEAILNGRQLSRTASHTSGAASAKPRRAASAVPQAPVISEGSNGPLEKSIARAREWFSRSQSMDGAGDDLKKLCETRLKELDEWERKVNGDGNDNDTVAAPAKKN